MKPEDLNMSAWAKELLFRQMMKHPLPWKVEQDWTWEVIAADGACIAKFQTWSDAQVMVSAAEALQVYLVESKREADDHMRKLGYADLIDD
jgi:hypothetical protein